jgi:hypothetical protein
MIQRKGFDLMRTRTLQAVAITLGLGVCAGTVDAQNSYIAPAKWSNFRTVSDDGESVPPAPVADLPSPKADHSSHAPAVPAPYSNGAYSNAPLASPAPAVGTGCAPCQSDAYSSPYSQAMSAPWSGAESCSDGTCGTSDRLPLNPWFGSANLLFYTLESGRGRLLATGAGVGVLRSSAVDPSASLGFDIGMGRYFGCGQYGVGINYMNWDPGSESRTISPIAIGDVRAEVLGYNDVDFDDGRGVESVYDTINGAGAYGAAGVRLRRDLSFQGIEANLFCFGLMGAQRASYAGCNPGFLGCGAGTGFGGAAGPLVRPTSGRARIMTSHGFRWFQVRDDFESAWNIDGAGGYQATDLYDRVSVENNLFGYQFGGMLNYCLTSRLNANIGGKFGIYGNNVDFRHRLGTETDLAYLTASGTDDIDVESSDTVLAGLGELDMGLGYRISNAWSIRGGYRMMAITGVADAVENMQNADYNSIAAVSQFDANDCHILHGGYVGLTFNW